MGNQTPFLDSIQFKPEKALVEDLFDRFDLEHIVKHQEETGELLKVYELVISTQLRLTSVMAPRLFSLFNETREELNFGNSTDLFVYADSSINAFSIYSTNEERNHIVSLTSGMVERMNDDELRFSIGHELGHIYYRHSRPQLLYSAFEEDPQTKESKMPPYLKRRLESWDRLAEISADRAGFVAVKGQIEPIVSAFFKITCGLGPEHLSFDIRAFLNQLAELRNMKRRAILTMFSHPITPVRVRSLQLFGKYLGRRDQLNSISELDSQVSELTDLMEHEVHDPLDIYARDFLLAAGILAAHADGTNPTDEQITMLINFLLPLASDPEAELKRFGNRQEAETMMSKTMHWLKKNAGEERFLLFRHIACLVTNDGVLTEDEKEFMFSIARELGIPIKSAENILFEILSGSLQTKSCCQFERFRLN